MTFLRNLSCLCALDCRSVRVIGCEVDKVIREGLIWTR